MKTLSLVSAFVALATAVAGAEAGGTFQAAGLSCAKLSIDRIEYAVRGSDAATSSKAAPVVIEGLAITDATAGDSFAELVIERVRIDDDLPRFTAPCGSHQLRLGTGATDACPPGQHHNVGSGRELSRPGNSPCADRVDRVAAAVRVAEDDDDPRRSVRHEPR